LGANQATGAGGVLGLIPARGGSKALPRKNLAPLAGRPLIAHTIAAALEAAGLERVIVSTDDEEIARVARTHGAEAPFLRPAELAEDASPAVAVMRHAVQWLEENQGWRAGVVVYLQPTSPLRRAGHIDRAVELLWREEADSVVSVVEVPHSFSPVSVMRLEDGLLRPYLGETGPLRRQDKPRLYARNGPAVLAVKRDTVMQGEGPFGQLVLPLVMDAAESVDIDSAFDLELAEWLISRRKAD